LPKHYPDRRVLGVLIPAAEAAVAATKSRRVGLIATRGTVASRTFDNELRKLDPQVTLTSNPAPLLVPLVENDGLKWAGPILEEYLAPLASTDTLILGCTHYPYMKDVIRQKVGEKVAVVSQDEIVPPKLANYLSRHPDLERKLSKGGRRQFQVTDVTDDTRKLARELFSEPIDLELIPQLK
jgi:glutamate racemase